ncbi:hypothetical protein CPB84DRAFT_1766713 [Gymnopilus junonius]|uniref:Transmembrane protein 135 N-terminal domain-containing protein n=1 Tax=Gymnopilus junonius TaxID=109634 RepID=A0A9P5NWH4_GYMJU|nr:hypothetical protein CPB84DRAFT_1766713 [Gymnopilus junonius]
MPSSQQGKRGGASQRTQSWFDQTPSLSDDSTHPAQIAFRTYALALSLSLGPSLLPFTVALFSRKARSSPRTSLKALKAILRRELGYDAFAFAVTFAVAGGAALRRYLWNLSNEVEKVNPFVEEPTLRNVFSYLKTRISRLSPAQQTFISNVTSSSIGILLIQSGRERVLHRRLARRTPSYPSTEHASPTLDLTLLLFVRAVDSILQAFILRKPLPASDLDDDTQAHLADPRLVLDRLTKEKVKRENKMRQNLTSQIDALVFWACSARIMWCFFYEPQRLPRSYVKWISTLANLDKRIILALQHIRTGKWSYVSGSPLYSGLLQDAARDVDLPVSWGDPNLLPAYGRAVADEAWKKLGVSSRSGVGGIPCEVLHRRVGFSMGLTQSCTANAVLRTLKGFTEALVIYLPVHLLPVLLTRPQSLLRPVRLLQTFIGAFRSATFLSSFIGLYWYSVCFTRSLVLAKLFPFISHDFWDGPYGCIMAGCLMCGSSIWIESGRRRGEMALYVLPRAVRACLPDAWVKSGNKAARLAERLMFVLSFSTLLTAAIHRPDSLRGLSRWTLAFVTKGPNAGFWKRKRRDPTIPPTPSVPPTPFKPPDVDISGSVHAHTPEIGQ